MQGCRQIEAVEAHFGLAGFVVADIGRVASSMASSDRDRAENALALELGVEGPTLRLPGMARTYVKPLMQVVSPVHALRCSM